ncbi:hypothetical protein N2M06_03750 [Oceanimonas sp. AH20CE76]|uniref:hypothetical protein n=1 Tax=Oceanimonas TaxID=129577 RepID=UPI00293550D2|nr:hypothetical protein [Oceanimonas sp. CAM02]MDV2857162.1 hypothetical protein [Oceanimonas sp. CAM02]
MKFRIRSHPQLRAAGSVMEIWPMGNYIEYMPKGTAQQRIEQCWQRVGNQLTHSFKVYKKQQHGT